MSSELCMTKKNDGGCSSHESPDGKIKQNKKQKFAPYERNSKRENKEKFPGRLDVPVETLKKYDFGPDMEGTPQLSGKGRYKRHKLLQKEKLVEQGREDTARAELLLTEQSGHLEALPGFTTTSLRQCQIVGLVDITTQKKRFDLKLNEFGPYNSMVKEFMSWTQILARFRYSRDGRQLALAGQLGHLASLDWLTKSLSMEINVMESLHDVAFLQDTRTIAVAQKKWTSVYDSNGTEIHSVKDFNEIIKLEYLPYHFLLAGLGLLGHLHYLDVSLGKIVARIPTRDRTAITMAHNPYNGVVTTAHPGGTVSMWTPNSQEAVATMLCHKAPIADIGYDPCGKYLVTASRTREVRVWDARNLGETIHSVRVRPPTLRCLTLSQSGLLAVGYERHLEVYQGLGTGSVIPYMTHRTTQPLHHLQFCPYEDLLGVSTRNGFSSIIIPGAGEPNFDAAEVNPFSSSSCRRESLVKDLLQKIPSELITLDPSTVAQVDIPTLEERLEARRKLIHVNVPHIDPHPRFRMKGKSGSAQMAKRKMIKKDIHKQRYLEGIKHRRIAAGIDKEDEEKPIIKDRHREKLYENALDRFN